MVGKMRPHDPAMIPHPASFTVIAPPGAAKTNAADLRQCQTRRLQYRPDIINFKIDGKTEWDKMAEFKVS
ncbi:hypothetical protein [Corynebacterium sp.]|uniref:hypothetical protein n=1 Tax=Corynebacterium sp. TaxID=1720 RepID=UPI00257E97CD|nr:hypothetical protein [Corynebacterium sp.]